MVIKRLFLSRFLRNITLLSGGSAVSIAVPIIAAPILGRLYEPHEYGALAQYIAFASILGVVGPMQFQHAIISERTLTGAFQVTWLSIMSALFISALVAIGVALAWPVWLSGTAAGAWFWLLPISVGISGIVAGGSFLANRMGLYRRLATIPVLQTVITVGTSIALGFADWGSSGLLTAYFAGQILQVIAYGAFLVRYAPGIRNTRRRSLMLRLRRHWRFAAFTLPSEFAGQINAQAPVFALSAVGASATLGAFSRARQLVSMPMTALGGAVAQVFRREAAEQYNATGSCRRLMLRTAGTLLALGSLPCLIILLEGPLLFEIYLGPAWREAGEIARILAPMMLLQLVVSPVATIFYISGHQVEDLLLSLTSFFAMSSMILFSIFNDSDGKSIIIYYSLSYCAIYLLYLFRSLSLSVKKESRL